MIRTCVQTFRARIAGRTDTFAGYMMTIAAIIALALILTICAVRVLATVRAHITGPAGRTITFARLWITLSTVLTFTFGLAFFAVFAVRTLFRA